MTRRMALFGAAAAFAMTPLAAMAERGDSGHLNLIYWQAPSIMNPYLSGGTKEQEASSIVLEPLARYNERGELVPWLAESIPTVENGGVSEDLMSITWRLREGLLWSDGTPVTSADVAFTAQYCMSPDGGCAQLRNFNDVESIEVVDDRTVTVHFSVPKPVPYGPFVSATSPIIQRAQFENCLGANAPTCTDANFMPIGTGAFRVVEFRPNDVIQMEANPNYRDPALPHFATLTLKGGGDAASAGRAVMETGEMDYAWNLQLAPDVIATMAQGGHGVPISAFGTLVERIEMNLTDPSPDLPPETRSTRAAPHPFLSDIRVRQALSMAIDRPLLVEVGYGQAGRVACNIVPNPPVFRSEANEGCAVQDLDGARALLDAAGWVPGPDGIRVKDGRRLVVDYQTSTNAVRQDFQALIQQWWREIGVEANLRNVNASVFFGGDPGSPDTFQKFYADVEMYANNFTGTDPENYLGAWRCDHEPRPATQWQGENINRFCDPTYDALHLQMAQTADINERGRIGRELNDILVQNYVVVPLVDRGRVDAHANSLGGVLLNVWDSGLWNIADWYRIQ
ncbi:MAG: peptide ABC transporter substrate-binding protein [Rhodobacter sp.]|uniref:peptide ABC transporter substrate-binding protein n=1 Tax=Pararhodobacter sp. TaxID=2127056 RepID=UPI001D39BB3A|nr:peptide ABC transporter substrate-binding protein [Pararhodobacter sp.]MCB1346211.1 peptide ABC transporter substrate-binding protein [Paracoccaceae bacterium]MCB1409101.1 peptide ABC transporter substrate-binding protein [Paracoccaceae bacterium]MCC0074438.1 peptide ABC transporter substrate-binding protein [Rhodobacter sp.]HPD91418.1 peptide ABC transporter substrate-binding protein [Pararhodobacter sp.]